MGRVTEIAGLESSGKSYMAGQIAAQAQTKGIQVMYFDSESTMTDEFLEKLGIKQIIISTEKNPVVSARALKLGIPCSQGIENKSLALIDYCKDNSQNHQID